MGELMAAREFVLSYNAIAAIGTTPRLKERIIVAEDFTDALRQAIAVRGLMRSLTPRHYLPASVFVPVAANAA